MSQKYINPEDFKDYLANLAGSKRPERNIHLSKSIYYSGLRIHEALKFTPNDMKFPEYEIFLIGKGNKARKVKIPKIFFNEIKRYIKINKIKNGEKVFPITRQNFDYVIRNHTKANNSAHDLRDSYLINLLIKTKNLNFVARQAGHKTPRVTIEKYLIFMPYEIEEQLIEEMTEW